MLRGDMFICRVLLVEEAPGAHAARENTDARVPEKRGVFRGAWVPPDQKIGSLTLWAQHPCTAQESKRAVLHTHVASPQLSHRPQRCVEADNEANSKDIRGYRLILSRVAQHTIAM
jgi:hypothetical protein